MCLFWNYIYKGVVLMKKWLFILVISFFVFMPKDVFASSTQTSFNFTSTDIAVETS